MKQHSWQLGVKRGFDVLGAATGLILFSPVIAVTSIAVRISMGSPVVFKQERGGRDGSTFVLLKFRTMLDARGSNGEPLSDEARLTLTGKILRSLSLDELPQLWNVLRGDMSLIGPRPLLSKYLRLYSSRQAKRHDMLPGITGWAQVNGRNAVDYDQRFELDVWYVENWSLALDARILWLTFLTVISRSGIASDSYATMPEFCGSPPLDSPLKDFRGNVAADGIRETVGGAI